MMRGEVVAAQSANAGARAFGSGLVVCPDCGHGIDPHGADPGGPCGVGGCPCLMQPNGIACLLIDQREEFADALAAQRRTLDEGRRSSIERLSAERDELRATVARVSDLADDGAHGRDCAWFDTPEWSLEFCDCWRRDVREALAGDL